MPILTRPTLRNKRVLLGIISLAFLCAGIAVGFANRKLSQPKALAKLTTALSAPAAHKTLHLQNEQPQSTAQVELPRNAIAGGGGTSSAGNLKVEGTVGQSAAGTQMSNGQFSQTGGFWQPQSEAIPTPTPTPTSTPTPTPTSTPALSINDVSVIEGAGGMTEAVFTVTLSAPSALTVTVDFATADGSAQLGSDYQPTSGSLTFNAGDTSKTITVLVNGDTEDETNETLIVNLTNPSNAAIQKAQGTGTIINDDSLSPPLVQFNSSSYSIAEELTAVVVTVMRVGDTSGTATVEYATSNDTASQKGDYEIASGMLTFAPGDTSKTFKVLINEDSYVEGTERLTLTLSNPSGASLGAQSTAVVTINDDAIESFTNPNDDAQNFVYMQYHDFLNREPDAGGLAYWTGQITQCGNDQSCVNAKRRAVSAAFFIELEFQETGYFVYRIQKASYGTQPSYQQFMADRGRVKSGPQLEPSKQAFTTAWMQRPAFKAAYSDAMTAEQFVTKLFDTAGLMGYQNERLQAIQDLMNASKTRTQVLRDVLENPEFKTREYNPSFVLMQYFGYLRRNADQAGYEFWLNVISNQLPQDQGGYHAMVCAFITSAEYQDRFSAVHSHSNADCGP
jgi:hypothetical protein